MLGKSVAVVHKLLLGFNAHYSWWRRQVIEKEAKTPLHWRTSARDNTSDDRPRRKQAFSLIDVLVVESQSSLPVRFNFWGTNPIGTEGGLGGGKLIGDKVWLPAQLVVKTASQRKGSKILFMQGLLLPERQHFSWHDTPSPSDELVGEKAALWQHVAWLGVRKKISHDTTESGTAVVHNTPMHQWQHTSEGGNAPVAAMHQWQSWNGAGGGKSFCWKSPTGCSRVPAASLSWERRWL